jgi:hypothetical protein
MLGTIGGGLGSSSATSISGRNSVGRRGYQFQGFQQCFWLIVDGNALARSGFVRISANTQNRHQASLLPHGRNEYALVTLGNRMAEQSCINRVGFHEADGLSIEYASSTAYPLLLNSKVRVTRRRTKRVPDFEARLTRTFTRRPRSASPLLLHQQTCPEWTYERTSLRMLSGAWWKRNCRPSHLEKISYCRNAGSPLLLVRVERARKQCQIALLRKAELLPVRNLARCTLLNE